MPEKSDGIHAFLLPHLQRRIYVKSDSREQILSVRRSFPFRSTEPIRVPPEDLSKVQTMMADPPGLELRYGDWCRILRGPYKGSIAAILGPLSNDNFVEVATIPILSIFMAALDKKASSGKRKRSTTGKIFLSYATLLNNVAEDELQTMQIRGIDQTVWLGHRFTKDGLHVMWLDFLHIKLEPELPIGELSQYLKDSVSYLPAFTRISNQIKKSWVFGQRVRDKTNRDTLYRLIDLDENTWIATLRPINEELLVPLSDLEVSGEMIVASHINTLEIYPEIGESFLVAAGDHEGVSGIVVGLSDNEYHASILKGGKWDTKYRPTAEIVSVIAFHGIGFIDD
jgi:hypothetical protein